VARKPRMQPNNGGISTEQLHVRNASVFSHKMRPESSLTICFAVAVLGHNHERIYQHFSFPDTEFS